MAMWEEYYSVLDAPPDWLKKPVPFIVDSVSLFRKHGARVFLDLGCGIGRNAIYLGKEGFDVVGADISRSALKKAKGWSESEGTRSVSVLCCSMTALPFTEQTFHAVISVSVVHHACKNDIKKAVEEIHAVLRNNGLFVANLLSTEDYRYASGDKLESGTYRVLEDFEGKQFEEVHHFFSRKEIQSLLKSFKKIALGVIRSGLVQPHDYWKVVAIK
jgi:ubiquinone/menaquinone biosynthesis C-methylase UbiE